MASVQLDLVDYQDADGRFDAQVVHDLVRDLDVTFDEADTRYDPEPGVVLFALVVEFTGPREDLVALIDRYVGPEYDNDPDTDPRPELVAQIKD